MEKHELLQRTLKSRHFEFDLARFVVGVVVGVVVVVVVVVVAVAESGVVTD